MIKQCNKKMANIEDGKDLAEFLNFQATKFHDKYFHYTSLDKLNKILFDKTFMLTRGDSESLNDQHEVNVKMNPEARKTTYFSCFTYGNYDNFAMWGLYGFPKTKAVRIEIPFSCIEKMLKSKCKYKEDNDEYKYFDEKENIKLYVNDVFYAQGSNILPGPYKQFHNNIELTFKNGIDLHSFLQEEALAGCVKNYGWHFEEEVRLVARFKKEHIAKEIYIDIPDDCLKTFKITTGPNFSNRKMLDGILNKNRLDIPIQDNIFKSLIKFKH